MPKVYPAGRSEAYPNPGFLNPVSAAETAALTGGTFNSPRLIPA
ncbi:MAG: hypothetical protein JWO38_4708 [Gemmataceae bacterium]|nr:hypothetical protein [Gemmataceae bacterium]